MDLFDLPPSENQDLVSQANIYAGQLDTLQVRLQYCQANVDPRLKSLLGKASNRFHEAVQTGRGLASLDIKAADKLVAVANKVCDQIAANKSINQPAVSRQGNLTRQFRCVWSIPGISELSQTESPAGPISQEERDVLALEWVFDNNPAVIPVILRVANQARTALLRAGYADSSQLVGKHSALVEIQDSLIRYARDVCPTREKDPSESRQIRELRISWFESLIQADSTVDDFVGHKGRCHA